MDVLNHISAIEQEATLFAEAADAGGFDLPIEGCPGWTMRDLVRHLSEIHLWAAAHVALRATKMWVDDLAELSAHWPDLAEFWPADDDLVDFYRRTNDNLVRELTSAPADLDAMTFLPAPTPLAMWARRQAHEIAIHRFDAEHAAGRPTDYDGAFASDGIDELLMAFAPRKDSFPIDARTTMAVHAADTGDHWHLTLAPDGITSTRDDDAGDLVISGRASDVYLAMWNRGDDNALDMTGDRSVLDAWHLGNRIRWS